jgi:cell division protein FtsL
MFVASALAVVVNKDRSRSLFIETQRKKKELDDYEVQWGKLQLELTTLTEEGLIEQVAKEQLKLIMPQRKKTIYIKP